MLVIFHSHYNDTTSHVSEHMFKLNNQFRTNYVKVSPSKFFIWVGQCQQCLAPSGHSA